MKSAQLATLGLTILSSGMSALVFAENLTLTIGHPVAHSFCALVQSQHWTARKPNTDWKLDYAPLAFPIPPDLRARCLTHPDQPKTHCLVLQSAGYTFWTYQNSSGTVLLAYDTSGNLVDRWEIHGLLVVDIKINPLTDTVDFIGEKGEISSFTWNELSLDPAHNLPPAPPPDIPKTSQIITLETPASLTVGASLSLNPTGGASKNPVTLESTTPQNCSINGNQLTALKAGTCTIVARQDGNEHFLAATDLEKSFIINAPAPAPINTAPSQLCFNVTGNYTTDSGITRAGYCNDYRFNNNGVPCLSIVNGTEITAGSCEVNQLLPRPYPIKSLIATGRAEISTTYSARTPRCDNSTQFTEARVKLPNALAFTCIRYERDAATNSFYYGIALLSNTQILSYKLETTPDRCVGQCPVSP